MELRLPDTLQVESDKLSNEVLENDPIKVSCSCYQHDKRVMIREGNSAYFGLLIDDSFSDYTVTELRCPESSQKELYDSTVGRRNSKDEHILVVQGQLMPAENADAKIGNITIKKKSVMQ